MEVHHSQKETVQSLREILLRIYCLVQMQQTVHELPSPMSILEPQPLLSQGQPEQLHLLQPAFSARQVNKPCSWVTIQQVMCKLSPASQQLSRHKEQILLPTAH